MLPPLRHCLNSFGSGEITLWEWLINYRYWRRGTVGQGLTTGEWWGNRYQPIEDEV